MSIAAYKAVWSHSKATGGAKLLLLALAEHVYGDDGRCWPGISRLSSMIGACERQTKRLIKELEGLGEIEVERSAGRGRTSEYRILLPMTVPEKVTSEVEKVTNPAEKVTPVSPLPETEKVTNPVKKVTSEVKKVTSEVKKVTPMSPQSVIEPEESVIEPEDHMFTDPAENAKWQKLIDLLEEFERLTRIKRPDHATKRGMAVLRERWLEPLAEIERIGNGRSLDLIRETVVYMRERQLTIAAPRSLVNVAATLAHTPAPAGAPASVQPRPESARERLQRIGVLDV